MQYGNYEFRVLEWGSQTYHLFNLTAKNQSPHLAVYRFQRYILLKCSDLQRYVAINCDYNREYKRTEDYTYIRTKSEAERSVTQSLLTEHVACHTNFT